MIGSPSVLFVFSVFTWRAFGVSDPYTLPLPPLKSVSIRLRALLSPRPSNPSYAKFPLRNRLFLLFRAAVYFLMSPFWIFMWTLDDLLFADYKKVELKSPVFLVGGFRTGSTSLHRALSLDTSRYCSPRFVELAMPFLTLHYFLDWLESLDSRFGTSFIPSIEASFQRVLGPECMARHPMSYHSAEEDDVLHAAWHLAGWYVGTMFPDADAWREAGQMRATYDEGQRSKMSRFYRRSVQKVLYRRGEGRQLLSKSHLIEFMHAVEEEFPGAHFVGTVRDPKDTFVSWYALAQAASKVMAGGWELPREAAVSAHLTFWDLFSGAEMSFFSSRSTSSNKTVVSFKDYIADQEGTVRRIYEAMGVPVSEKFGEALRDDKERHENYKAKRGYKNPELEELRPGLGKVIDERMEAYRKEFGL